ncbi:PP-loop ATPase [Tubulinosema ratisbonensis]|uniref:Diphthine--ammonia ligase n=1 Tax=Tubulinosema ratisbonensis TaxID=291195 RepID=A0A437APL9_9MICR|nr:PP-loop ATPase [Tubulinosema ratisbonensis]
MNFIALISGGKDSIYTVNLLIKEGYKLQGLVYIYSVSDTIDSYMYQTVGKEVIQAYSQCLNVPLFVKESKCLAKNTDLNYKPTNEDEVEDLFFVLKEIPLDYQAVSSGAILSSYQKNRVDSVCKRLNKVSLAPLYNKNQLNLLQEMINYKIKALVVKVAGIEKEFLLKNLEDLYEYYKDKPHHNACGEGGEYETIVLDSPCFVKRIVFTKTEILPHPDEIGKKENCFFVKIHEFKLENK